jgi:hypothetical protein
VRPRDDRVFWYAVEPSLYAEGGAAGVIVLGALLRLPHSPSVRFGVLVPDTFFAVSLLCSAWRIFWRWRDPSLYRAGGKAWTPDADPMRRVALVGVAAGCLIPAFVSFTAR